MKKYRVTLYYHTFATVDVMAHDEEEAKKISYEKIACVDYDNELLSNLEEDSDSDIEEL